MEETFPTVDVIIKYHFQLCQGKSFMQKPSVTYDKDCVLMMFNNEAFGMMQAMITLYAQAVIEAQKKDLSMPQKPTYDDIISQLVVAKEVGGWKQTLQEYALSLFLASINNAFVWKIDVNGNDDKFMLCQLN